MKGHIKTVTWGDLAHGFSQVLPEYSKNLTVPPLTWSSLMYGRPLDDIDLDRQTFGDLSTYGLAVIIPSEKQKKRLWRDAVTVYIDVPANGNNARKWVRKVLLRSNVQGQTYEQTSGTVRSIRDSKTVYTNAEGFVYPDEFYAEKDQSMCYTVAPGDAVILGIVDDVITTAEEAANLWKKYKNRMIKAKTINVWKNGMILDHIEISEA